MNEILTSLRAGNATRSVESQSQRSHSRARYNENFDNQEIADDTHSKTSESEDSSSSEAEKEPHNKRMSKIEAQLGQVMKNQKKAKEVEDSDSSDDELGLNDPFTIEIQAAVIPPNFKPPQMELYDGTGDPVEHLQSYRSHMSLKGTDDATLCRAFSSTLRKAGWAWFTNLRPGSIGSFKQLAKEFKSHFTTSRAYKKTDASLLALAQNKGESLREFVGRFNAACLEVQDLNQGLAVAAFVKGVRHHGLLKSLAKKMPKTLKKLLKKAQQHKR